MVSQVMQAQMKSVRFYQSASEAAGSLNLLRANQDFSRGRIVGQQGKEKPICFWRWRRDAGQAKLIRHGHGPSRTWKASIGRDMNTRVNTVCSLLKDCMRD
jgi:hypothetical protein